MNDVVYSLGRLRRRMMVQFFIERLAICSLAFAGILVAVAGVDTMRGVSSLDVRFCVGAFCATFAAALAWTWSKFPTLEQTAVCVDAAAGTRDRFLTAYDFSKLTACTALESMAMQECARFIAAFDVKACTRFRAPRLLSWLLVPVTALCLLALHAGFARKSAGEGMEKDVVTGHQTQELEKIAQAVGQTKSDELKKIADEIRKSEKRIKTAPEDEAAKTALHEMSSLENLIQEMLKSQKKASPEEIAALAGALKQSELTKEAASALEAGKTDQAAQKLEQLLQQQKENPQLDKTGQAVQQALASLAENQKGEISQELQRPGQSGNSDQKSAGAQALQRLAEMLRKAGGNPQQQNDTANSSSGEALQNILSQLQNLKYAGQSGQTGADSRQGEAGSKMIMPSGPPVDAKGQSTLVTTGAPSGTHGDKDDTGTTKDPFGQQQKKSDVAAPPQQLNGVNGDGQSLHEFMTATGDHSQSNLRYRELYDSMLPAAEEAVMQENIPPGSRFYIKRYFQNIRPKE